MRGGVGDCDVTGCVEVQTSAEEALHVVLVIPGVRGDTICPRSQPYDAVDASRADVHASGPIVGVAVPQIHDNAPA